MKITPGITWASGDTVTHTKLNNFLANATIGSGDQAEVALGDGALDSLTSGTDNVALGDNAGTAVSSGSDNAFIGQNTGLALTDGDSNTAMGKDAFKSNTSGQHNVAVGEDAMGSSTGSPLQNVAVGNSALKNCSGSGAGSEAAWNVAIGNNAGATLTTGKLNTFLGMSAGQQLATNSYSNVAVGHDALGNGTSAVDGAVAVGESALAVNTADINTAVGYKAGYSNTSGDDNTYVGSQAGYTNATATDNTFIGDNAGYYSTGSNNTALGSQANATSGAAAYVNTTALGYGPVLTASNQVRLGNASVSTFHCQVALTVDSDERIKKNVKDSGIGLDFVNALRSVSYKKVNPYNWPDELKEDCFKGLGPDGVTAEKPADDPTTYVGFVAQEVKAVADALGITEWDGWRRGDNGMESLTATAMIPPLVKAVQELSAKVAALEAAG